MLAALSPEDRGRLAALLAANRPDAMPGSLNAPQQRKMGEVDG
jgi:hypothetical protein